MSSRRLSPSGGAVLTALLLTALTIALAALAPAGANAEEACTNAAVRVEASANLPDCRAYELVTPEVKGDNSFMAEMYGFADGQHVVFDTYLPLPGAKSGSSQAGLSSRTASGWVTTPVTPPQGPGQLENLDESDNEEDLRHGSFTSDFSAGFVSTSFSSDPLDQNLDPDVYRVEIPGGSSSLVSLPDSGPITEELYTPPGVTRGPGSYVSGNSADGSHVFFSTEGRLPTAPGTPADTTAGGSYQTYERYASHTYLVGILPDGSAAPCGAEVGEGGNTGNDYYGYIRYGAVSPDGSNVVFRSPAFGGCEEAEGLYLREDNGTPEAKTVQLPGLFYLGRAGSTILSTGGPGGSSEGEPIYEYDVPSGQVTTIGYGALEAYSADGSRVYYLTHLRGGDEQQLKVYDRGVTETIPNAGPGYFSGEYLSEAPTKPTFRENLPVATPDGSKLLFLDRTDLTSYDSYGPRCEEVNREANFDFNHFEENHCSEAYIYDLETGSFTCVSCNPSGAPPLTDVEFAKQPTEGISIPLTMSLLSEDGSRALFQTTEALVPQDTNGLNDVYEWENGHIYLLSSGLGGGGAGGLGGVAGSKLIGASSNGDNVFFATTDHLAPQDIESSLEIYDARVDGGFPNTTPAVYGCDSGQCQGPQTPAPAFAPPASATFVGVGNPSREESGVATKSKSRAKKSKATVAPKRRRKSQRQSEKGRKKNRQGRGRS
jgi:hypothetical protein